METVVLLVILIGAVSGDSHRDRRILLHSDVDIAQAIQSLKTDSVQVKSDLIHLQGTVSQLQSHNSQLQGTVSQLQSQNSQLNGSVSRLQSHNSQLQGTVSQLQSQNSQLNGSVTQLQSHNSQLQGTMSQLQSQNSQLNGSVTQLQSQNSQIQGTVSQLQIQNSQLNGSVTQLQSQNSQLQSQNSQLQSTVNHLQSTNKGTGSSYVRWGRTSCPANGTKLAYSGYMGGGRYNDTGAAVNRLCLTADPIWDHYTDNMDSWSKMYGVEYEFWSHRADSAFFGTNMLDQDAPCAVCHSPRSAAMMIPGRNQCYPGWTKEYSGYLVSGDPADPAATEYICLDRRAESLPGGGRSDNENVLYLVEGVCGGSLECPPYINGRELTCVVCTK